MKNYSAAGVGGYISGVPEGQRAMLRKLRAQIKAAAPGSEEKIAWGVPAYKYKGKYICGFSSFKAHCAINPFCNVRSILSASDLKGFETTLFFIRFTPEKPLSAALVKKIVKAKMKLIDEGKVRM